MSELARPRFEYAYRLPLPGWPRAVFRSDLDYRDARLSLDDRAVLVAETREELERGVEGQVSDDARPIAMQLTDRAGRIELVVRVDGKKALREDGIWARPTRSAWIHAWIALAGSAAGFAASGFYLLKAAELHNEWAQKMGMHTAGWHLLLTFTLFPASVWGQRFGIRAVQFVSLVFFLIHAGIALANSAVDDAWIGAFNALSGICFLASLVYGNRAYRDMDPLVALREGRV